MSLVVNEDRAAPLVTTHSPLPHDRESIRNQKTHPMTWHGDRATAMNETVDVALAAAAGRARWRLVIERDHATHIIRPQARAFWRWTDSRVGKHEREERRRRTSLLRVFPCCGCQQAIASPGNREIVAPRVPSTEHRPTVAHTNKYTPFVRAAKRRTAHPTPRSRLSLRLRPCLRPRPHPGASSQSRLVVTPAAHAGPEPTIGTVRPLPERMCARWTRGCRLRGGGWHILPRLRAEGGKLPPA